MPYLCDSYFRHYYVDIYSQTNKKHMHNPTTTTNNFWVLLHQSNVGFQTCTITTAVADKLKVKTW